jgi:hypothetical protein
LLFAAQQRDEQRAFAGRSRRIGSLVWPSIGNGGRQRGLDRAIVKAMPSRFMAWRSGALHELMAFAVTRRAGQPKA